MKQTAMVFVVLSIFGLIGCGGSELLIQPKYSNTIIKENKITTSSVKISSVIDRRNADAHTIGSAKVGMFNKTVPYKISIPLSDFVKTVIDSTIQRKDSSIIPAVVYVDTFEVGEKYSLFSENGIMKTVMYWGVPVSPDSMMYITTRFDDIVSSGVDVTDQLEPLIYKGIVDCAKQCTDKLHSMNIQLYAASPDSLSSFVTQSAPADIAKKAVEAVDPGSKPKIYNDIGVAYSEGDRITTGVRIFYNTLSQKDSSKMMYGFGYNLEVLKITNTSAGIEGSMITFGGNLMLRALLNDAKVSPYVGGSLTLTFGSESIDYGTHKESSFYFGPFVRESIGLSFNKKFYVEIGAFQVKLFGSKMLPDDVGFTAGVSFGI